MKKFLFLLTVSVMGAYTLAVAEKEFTAPTEAELKEIASSDDPEAAMAAALAGATPEQAAAVVNQLVTIISNDSSLSSNASAAMIAQIVSVATEAMPTAEAKAVMVTEVVKNNDADSGGSNEVVAAIIVAATSGESTADAAKIVQQVLSSPDVDASAAQSVVSSVKQSTPAVMSNAAVQQVIANTPALTQAAQVTITAALVNLVRASVEAPPPAPVYNGQG